MNKEELLEKVYKLQKQQKQHKYRLVAEDLEVAEKQCKKLLVRKYDTYVNSENKLIKFSTMNSIHQINAMATLEHLWKNV
jgi:hypothetical protein